jgi:hypothetical protein
MSKTGRNCPCVCFVRSAVRSENKGIPQQLGRRRYSFSQIEVPAVCRPGAESQVLPLDTSKIIIDLCCVYVSISYRAVNTLRLSYKSSHLMLYREIIAVCSQIHTKHINTVWAESRIAECLFLALNKVTTGLYRAKHQLQTLK